MTKYTGFFTRVHTYCKMYTNVDTGIRILLSKDWHSRTLLSHFCTLVCTYLCIYVCTCDSHTL